MADFFFTVSIWAANALFNLLSCDEFLSCLMQHAESIDFLYGCCENFSMGVSSEDRTAAHDKLIKLQFFDPPERQRLIYID